MELNDNKNQDGLDSELKLQGSPQNFPNISILTKPNLTASLDMMQTEQRDFKGTEIFNYGRVRFTPNDDDYDDDDNNVQIGIRIDTTSVVESTSSSSSSSTTSDKMNLITIYSEYDDRWFGSFTARGKTTMDIVRHYDCEKLPIMLFNLKEWEYIYVPTVKDVYDPSEHKDVKKLYEDYVRYYSNDYFNGLCLSICVASGPTRVTWKLIAVMDYDNKDNNNNNNKKENVTVPSVTLCN